MTRFSLTLFLLVALCFCLTTPSWAQEEGLSQSENNRLIPEQKISTDGEDSLGPEQKPPSEKKELLTRQQKTLLLNGGSMLAIVVYGFLQWDYGEADFHFDSEGWFGHDTKYGGADKMGHFWSSYALSHLYSYAYRHWGYTDAEANLYGTLSGLGVQTFMEVADGFSSQGFSYEDMVMNIIGSGAAYVWGKYPSLSKKIDFRIEYKPQFNADDFGFSTNYERQKFLIALKADGFDFIKNPYLKYLEFHAGYYARGYEDHEEGGPDDRQRNIYVGLGFNVSRLVQKYVNTKVFNYIQIPYTSITKSFPLD